MATIAVEVPDEVFASPVDLPIWSLQQWDGKGVPAAVVLGWIDAQPFGGWSVALLADINPSELHAEDLPTYLRLWHQAEAYTAAHKSEAIGAVARAGAPGTRGLVIDPVAHEVSLALRTPVGEAQHQVYRQQRLERALPGTRAMALTGLLTAKHVAKIVAGTGRLTPEQCAEVEAIVLPGAEDLSVAQFARRVRRAVAKLDPRGLHERHRTEAADSDVTFEPADDAMSWLTAYLPAVDGLLVKKAVDHYALARKKRGDARPMGVLRVEALRLFAQAYLTGDVSDLVAAASGGPTHHGRAVEVGVVATPEALAGLADTPGDLVGVGPVPIETIREMAAAARMRWLTIDGQSGRLLDRNPTTWRVPPDLQAFTDAAYVTSVGPFSTVPADRCDSEHQVRFPDGATTADNIAPMDRAWHVAKTLRGLLVHRNPDGSITWTTPLGQTVTVEPYDYRLGP